MEDFMEDDGQDASDDECESLDISSLLDSSKDLGDFGFNFTQLHSNGTTSGNISQTTPSTFNQTTPGFPNITTTGFNFDWSAFENLVGLDVDNDSTYKDASIWIWKIVPPIVIILGSIGNLLTILVISRQLRRSSTAVFLIALAISDIMIIYCGPIREWIKQLNDVDIRHLSQPGCKASVYFTYASLQLSSWLLVVVTLQRAIAVRWPHKTNLRCSPKGALVVIGVLVVVIYGLNAHFIYGLGRNGFQKCDPLYASYANFHNKVWPWIDFAVVFVLPFSLLLFGNCIIIHQVNKQKLLRRRMSRGCERAGTLYERDTRMVTIMLILLSVVFFICLVPSTIYFILLPYNKKKLSKLLCKNDFAGHKKQHDMMTFWHTVVGCLSHFNATLNFVLYVISGSRFRKDIVATLCCKHSPHNVFKSLMSRRRSQYASSTVGTLVSSISPNRDNSKRKDSRSPSLNLNGIAKRLSKMKVRRKSSKPVKMKSNRYSADTELKTNPNDANPGVQRGVDVSVIDINDGISFSSNESDFNETNVDPIADKVNGVCNSKDMAITQLCLAMRNGSKLDTVPMNSHDNVHKGGTLSEQKGDKNILDADNVTQSHGVKETRINIDPVIDVDKGLFNIKDLAIAQLCVNASKLGKVPEKRDNVSSLDSFPEQEECDSVSDMDTDKSDNDCDTNCLDVDPLSSDIRELYNTSGMSMHATQGCDKTDDYEIARGYDNPCFCTEYDLGVI